MTQDEIDAALIEHGRAGRRRATEGRRSVRLRPRRRGGRRRCARPACRTRSSRGHLGHLRARLRRHPGHAPRPRGAGHHRDRPRAPGQGQRRRRLGGARAAAGGTLVVLMGVARLGAVAARADRRRQGSGDRPCASRSRARRRATHAPGHARDDRAEVEAAGIGSPAVTVIGAVAALRDELAWAERRPLHGRHVAVTRARARPAASSRACATWAPRSIECAVIRIEPIDGAADRRSRLHARVRDVARTRRSCCSSAAAATRARWPASTVAAIGPGHRRGAARGRASSPTSSPSARSPRGCSRRCRPTSRGPRALVARAEEARDTLPEGCAPPAPRSTSCRSIARSRACPGTPSALAADARGVHVVIDRRALCRGAPGRDLSGVRGVSIGPVTTATARELGVGARRRGSAARPRRPDRLAAPAPSRNLPKSEAPPAGAGPRSSTWIRGDWRRCEKLVG